MNLGADGQPEAATERFGFLQLCNMSLGFFGIQFAWGLQLANMSAIFEHLGAEANAIPILWLAAPLTGLLVQPLVGNFSDYTWGWLGRRRPYLLVGALLTAIALLLVPSSPSLWVAAALLYLLDTSANISMVPFRAWVGDLLPKEQRIEGFAIQSVMVGLGAIAASLLPWLLSHGFAIESSGSGSGAQSIPPTVELSFHIGIAILLFSVAWTATTTPEYPPENLEVFEQLRRERGGFLNSCQEVWTSLRQMPDPLKQLAWVQSFTWAGIFSLFLYFPTAVACNIFGAVDLNSELYNEGIEWAGVCFAMFNAISVIALFFLPGLAYRSSQKLVHGVSLAIGGISLIALWFVHEPLVLLLLMVGFGLAWASTLSIPFAILTQVVPSQKQGVYQGVFNMFVVLPEILMSLGFGWIMEHCLNDNRLAAVVVGGAFMVLAAALMPWVQLPEVQVEEVG